MVDSPTRLAAVVALTLALPMPTLAEDCRGMQIGVNLAGPEFGPPRGRYGFTYIYPNAAEVDYFVGKDMRLVRLPLHWETLQPVLAGPLDPAELARVRVMAPATETSSEGIRVTSPSPTVRMV